MVLPGGPTLRAGGLDLNGDGISDVWTMVFGAGGLNPNADTSGTGMTNRQKSLAGLNPYDPKASSG